MLHVNGRMTDPNDIILTACLVATVSFGALGCALGFVRARSRHVSVKALTKVFIHPRPIVTWLPAATEVVAFILTKARVR